MPIFEYRCKDCGHRFEKLVFGSQSLEVRCEKCGSQHVEKMISAFATSASQSDSVAGMGNSSCSSGGSGFS
ncbi:MAG: zinc ribbon domain-containing protein [Calditrichaeota bacterium]|nr:MAG: zinc ribbon domain-containing protein [Calditrichota bacterium]